MAQHAVGSGADLWERTIVGSSFQTPHTLRALSLEQDGIDTLPIAGAQQEFKIRLATNENRRDSASLLINKMYSWRGYETANAPDAIPNRITLVAVANEALVGTLTLGFDSEVGLLTDAMYKTEIDRLRQENRVICELTRLAVDQSIRSKKVLASLFHIAYIYGHNIHHCTDFVIEINPRHALFYKKMLGFEQWGEEKNCPRVNAPAVLLRLTLEYAERKIFELGGGTKRDAGEKSLYPYFFSQKEELGITNRLIQGN